MRDDLAPGNRFPDLRLPEHTGKELSLSEIAKQQPLVLAFARGWWCPKEQVRLRSRRESRRESSPSGRTPRGREIYRDVFQGDVPEEGAEVGRSPLDGRPWLVHDVERSDGRVALHVRKGGEDKTDPRHVRPG